MTTCNHAMYAIVDVFTQFFPQLSELVLPSIYEQFAVCIQQSTFETAPLLLKIHSYFFCLRLTALYVVV